MLFFAQRVLFALWCFYSTSLWGHHSQYSYLRVESTDKNTMLSAEWEVARADLEYALSSRFAGPVAQLDEANYRHISAFLLSRIHLQAAARPCHYTPGDLLPGKNPHYFKFTFNASCSAQNGALSVASTYMFDVDREHRMMVEFSQHGNSSSAVLAGTTDRAEFTLAAYSGQWLQIFREGVVHIFLGYDHILFLIALILPLFFSAELPSHRRRIVMLVKYCSTFTLAHSLTLALAGLKIISLPAALIEAAIALSICLIAANNLWQGWQEGLGIIFFLGLIHGFGFANVLQELSFGGSSPLVVLAGFNLGVEAGQLLIIGVLYPLLLVLGSRINWQGYVLRFASVSCGLMGFFWFVERI
jgi:hypothetical protein